MKRNSLQECSLQKRGAARMESKKKKVWNFLLDLDQKASGILFVVIMVLLFLQVVTRYVLGHSFTWTEELSVILFVWMTYFGISSAVTHRKHLRVSALLNAVPFKVRKGMLITDNVIFMVVCVYLIFPMLQLIRSLGAARTPILRIPKAVSYWLIPVAMVITCIKLVLDTIRLIHEDESNLGTSKPSIDLDALEKEYRDKQSGREE
jgi:TRAP-type C4-dicarboxylate transport system permease small subunit